MKVLLATETGVAPSAQSGRPGAIRVALEALGHKVVVATREESRITAFSNRVEAWAVTGAGGLPQRSRRHVNRLSRPLGDAAREVQPDVIVATSTLVLGAPVPDVPVIVWPDATFHSAVAFGGYRRFDRLSPRRRTAYEAQESALLRRARVVGLPTDAAVSVVRSFVPETRLMVAPFGPNLPAAVIDEVRAARRQRQRAMRLLFVAAEWERKGGDLVLAVVAELRRRGHTVDLTVIGRGRPASDDDGGAEYVGHLSASDPTQRVALIRAWSSADVLLVPSLADNFGAVVAEAAAVGVPVVASTQTGASEYVAQYGFGRVRRAEAAPTAQMVAEWADDVEVLVTSPETYVAACAPAAEVLNYASSITRLLAAAGVHGAL